MMHFSIISLMPELFQALHYGVVGRAIQESLVKIDVIDPRRWGLGSYRQVDDRPYGGGPGMVMLYEPLRQAIEYGLNMMPKGTKVIYLSPQGKQLKQGILNTLVDESQSLLFIAGRYEGIDERLIQNLVDEEWSIGDFVISGGELAALVFIDALIRLIPGALGHQDSAAEDSFNNELLDHPHYTRPQNIDNFAVPEVLIKGNHADIARWRRKQALGKTWLKRPDLIQKLSLNEEDQRLLTEFKHELTVSPQVSSALI